MEWTKEEKRDALLDFARLCLNRAMDASVDSADVQEIGVSLGLLIEDEATEKDCAEDFEGEPGDLIYRFAEWLK